MATTLVKKKEILSRHQTIEGSEVSIKDFMNGRNRKSLKDLKGKISFREDYDYKSLRT